MMAKGGAAVDDKSRWERQKKKIKTDRGSSAREDFVSAVKRKTKKSLERAIGRRWTSVTVLRGGQPWNAVWR